MRPLTLKMGAAYAAPYARHYARYCARIERNTRPSVGRLRGRVGPATQLNLEAKMQRKTRNAKRGQNAYWEGYAAAMAGTPLAANRHNGGRAAKYAKGHAKGLATRAAFAALSGTPYTKAQGKSVATRATLCGLANAQRGAA